MLVAITAGLLYAVSQWRIGNGIFGILRRPLGMALFFGLCTGKMQDAMIIGAYLTMCYLGIVVVGGNQPSDVGLASAVAIPIALATGASPEMALVIATPFGVIGVFIDQIRRIVNGYWGRLADKYAAEGNTGGISRCTILYTFLTNLILRFPPVFLIVYFGTDAVEFILRSLPGWVTNGLSVAGGVLPAFGFALILMVIGRKALYPFFFLGFFAAKYLGLSTIGAACFGIPMVLAMTLLGSEQEDTIMGRVRQLAAMGHSPIDDDDEDE